MKASSIIKHKPYLIWSTTNYDNLSDEAVVEAVLNFGDWEDVQKLFKIIGIKKAARIFKKQTSGQRSNYHDKTKNYFTHYFAHHAH